MDPAMALKTPAQLVDLVGTSLLPLRMAADLGGAFGLLGLLLAALGICSVLAYQVARRTQEIAVRRALGATSSRVSGDVVRQGILLAIAGCVIDVAAGAGVAHAVRSFMFGVRPLDPVTFAVVPTALFVVTLLASWLPARRTTAVEPSDALKSE
jgi:ABC-type lipoprotein release transport system permease subunit